MLEGVLGTRELLSTLHLLKTVVEVKALGPPHVSQLW